MNEPNFQIAVIRGDGTGQFFAQSRFTVGGRPLRPALADLDSDGVLDIVVGNFTGNSVSVRLGIDGLTYQPRVDYAVGDAPRHVRVADFTGDGVPDVIVTNSMSDDVSLLVGVGDGTFAGEVRFAVGSRPRDGAVLDANGDGALDFAVLNVISPREITVLLNQGAPCSAADFACPGGVLDFNDVVAFLGAFGAMDPSADLAPPMGVLDFNDVIAYLTLFAAGCP